MIVKGKIEINVPPEKIWPYLTQPEKTKPWFTHLKEFKYTSPQKGEGTTFFWKERSGKREFDLNFVTTEWKENRVFGFKMTSGDFLKSYEERWTIEPTQTGCKFGFNDKIELPWGPIGKIIGAFAKKKSEADGKEVLANLKKIAESSPRGR